MDGLTQIKDGSRPPDNTLLITFEGGDPMSPYLMQPYVLGAITVGLLFAATLLVVSISDAMRG